jgi:hypothetical protein
LVRSRDFLNAFLAHDTSEASPQTDEHVVYGSTEHWFITGDARQTDGANEPGTPEGVADVLRQHVVLEAESIDRMYLNVHVPVLQRWKGF